MSFKEFKDKSFDNPDLFNHVRSALLFGKGKMYGKVKDAVAQKDEEKVLDICCGTGEFSALFNTNYVGIDICDSFLDFAKRKYHKEFVHMDATRLNFKDKEFSKTIFISGMHHFSEENLARIYPELSRVTSERIVILDPVPQKYNPIAWLLYSMDRGACIREVEKQKEIVSRYFEIENIEVFQSFLYRLSVISCRPKVQ